MFRRKTPFVRLRRQPPVPGNFDEAATITVAGPILIPLTRVPISLPFLLAVLPPEIKTSVHVAALTHRRRPSLSAALPSSRHETLSSAFRPAGDHLHRVEHGFLACLAEPLHRR